MVYLQEAELHSDSWEMQDAHIIILPGKWELHLSKSKGLKRCLALTVLTNSTLCDSVFNYSVFVIKQILPGQQVDPSIALGMKLVFLWVLEFYQDLSLQSQCCA